jgi:hypothetical protein
MMFEVGSRVRMIESNRRAHDDGRYGVDDYHPTGTVEAIAPDGWLTVRWRSQLTRSVSPDQVELCPEPSLSGTVARAYAALDALESAVACNRSWRTGQ